MNDQRQHPTRPQEQLPGPEGAETAASAASAERLAASREQLDQIYAAADSILDEIDLSNNARFLEQVRQSGGE